MDLYELSDQILELLRKRGRLAYRTLKVQFQLNEEQLEALKDELLFAHPQIAEEDGRGLVWREPAEGSAIPSPTAASSGTTPTVSSAEAERRQLTVMFCDLVGSTALSAQLDPEDYRAVVQQYQQTCAEVIQRHEGYLAQYLGDGLLVYFGYPVAHEDEARRAVRTGLEIIEAIEGERMGHGEPLQVRIGIHTGLVVIGDVGASRRTEQLALGETPNLAARIQGLAEPNTVIISGTTQRLIDEHFESHPFGSHLVKGIDTPIAIYHVQSEQQGISPLAGRTTLTPLVGREQEEGLLIDRWEQAKEGRGQVVLLSGEPGIGKSRLAYTLRKHVTAEGSLLFEARCSSYHQHSAFYPLIDVLQRTLLFTRQDTDSEKAGKLERALALYRLQDALPLFAALLSLPTPVQYPALNLTPQKQKERTLQALLQLLIAQAERQATVSVWEDLHWVDPSSLEFLLLLIEQIPTTQLLLVLTFRPEFVPPWNPRSHISQLTLNRLGKKQVEAMIEKVATGKVLSLEIIEQIRIKTDGVPLFVEELTKNVIESVGTTGVGTHGGAPLQLAIPATLQEVLLARLDRLSDARQVAQLGATLGREFTYELLHAVAHLSETDLQAALSKLVEAEILYQRGVDKQARYVFKHALIQDIAYQSLLKSTRQQYHQRIAQTLEERFTDTKANQPELLAHHYTEAGLIEQAIPYWQQAGQRAVERSANVEAIVHFSKGLELFKILPESPQHTQQELTLQIALGPAVIAAKGYTAPEVERAYTRARELCRVVGETPQLFPVLVGLWVFYHVRADHQAAHQLAEQSLSLAQRVQEPYLLLSAHISLGETLFWAGELSAAREQFECGTTFCPPHHTRPAWVWVDYRVSCLAAPAVLLWCLGYPDQALRKSREVLVCARELAHPFSLAFALAWAAAVHRFCREGQRVQELAEWQIALAEERGFPDWLAWGMFSRGWALVEQRQGEEGIAQILQALAALRVTGAERTRSLCLGYLAEAYGKVGKKEEGLSVLAEALVVVDKTGECVHEAELYRLKGELTLQSSVQSVEFRVKETEACFLKAIEIARKQQAKSFELRAATSLARLWQQQGKQREAHTMLSDLYNWFTEGFDTKDLQEAKALLGELT